MSADESSDWCKVTLQNLWRHFLFQDVMFGGQSPMSPLQKLHLQRLHHYLTQIWGMSYKHNMFVKSVDVPTVWQTYRCIQRYSNQAKIHVVQHITYRMNLCPNYWLQDDSLLSEFVGKLPCPGFPVLPQSAVFLQSLASQIFAIQKTHFINHDAGTVVQLYSDAVLRCDEVTWFHGWNKSGRLIAWVTFNMSFTLPCPIVYEMRV